VKERQELVSTVLLAGSAILGVMVLVTLVGYSVESARAERLIRTALAGGAADANAVEKYVAKGKEVADAMKKKNLFAPPPPKKHPVSEVRGIIGNRVLIDGKDYGLGDSVGDAKIVAIEPTYVKIEWEGETKVFAPISAAGVAESGPEKSARDRGRREGKSGAEAERGESRADVRPEGSRDSSNVSSPSEEERLRMREERIRMLKQRKEAMRQRQRESD